MMIYNCYILVSNYHRAAKSSRNAYEMDIASDHRVSSLKLFARRSSSPLGALPFFFKP
jgi:hypothetical protein